MEKQKIQIRVCGTHHHNDEEKIENIYSGYYICRNGSHYISYQEYYEQESGPDATADTLIKISDRTVQMKKKGAITTKMIFDPTQPSPCPYHTPYGVFQMELFTQNLEIRRENLDFFIEIRYKLMMDGAPVTDCTIQLEVLF